MLTTLLRRLGLLPESTPAPGAEQTARRPSAPAGKGGAQGRGDGTGARKAAQGEGRSGGKTAKKAVDAAPSVGEKARGGGKGRGRRGGGTGGRKVDNGEGGARRKDGGGGRRRAKGQGDGGAQTLETGARKAAGTGGARSKAAGAKGPGRGKPGPGRGQQFAPTQPDPRGRPTVHILHIRKTAGTAIKAALAEVEPIGTERYALRTVPHGFRLKHVPPGDKIVAVLRDPIDRFVSGFFSRLRQGQPRYNSPWTERERTAFAAFRTPDALARALEAPDRATRAAAEDAMRGIAHVNTSYWTWFHDEGRMLARRDDILLLARQERLADDFARLRDLLGLSDTIRLPEGDAEAHRNPYDDDARLTPEAAAILRRWYARDYAFLDFVEREFGVAAHTGPAGWQKRLASPSAGG